MENQLRFMLIDDDPLANFINHEHIETNIRSPHEVLEFEKAALALDFILSESGPANSRQRTLILLDLNMPIMDGWDFVDKFNQLNESVRERYEIYIVSSSVDPRDISKAASIQAVKGYQEKPITSEFLNKIESGSRTPQAVKPG